MIIRKRRFRRRLLALTTVAITTTGMGSALIAHADVAEQAAPAASVANGCVAGAADAHCLRVGAELDRPLSADGAEAELTVSVTAPTAMPRMRTEIDLPALARWTDPPANMAITSSESAVPTDHGAISRATSVVEVAAGETVTWQGRVAGDRIGTELITARAFNEDAPESYSGSATVASEIGATAQDSSLGARPEDAAASAVAAPDGVRATRATPRLPYAPAPLRPAPDQAAPPAANAERTACASGEFLYEDENGITRTAQNIAVKAWDEDDFNTDDFLGQVVTDQNGQFELCFSNDDVSGGADLYLVFELSNELWQVEYDDDAYSFRTSTRNDVEDGSTQNFGAQTPSEPRYMRAVHAFDEANDAWNWTPGHCWDDLDGDECRQAKIVWNWEYNPDSNHYSHDDEKVHLQSEAPDFRSIVVHELGHSAMDDVYEGDFPEANCPSPHYVQRDSGANCAWTEGFADWYQAAVYDDPRYVGVGFEIDLEAPTWKTDGWDDGDGVEGRVAGAMIDLGDTHNDGDDEYAEPPTGPMWQTFLHHKSNNFERFWQQRAADGHDVSNPALGALFQNTIDYGFEE